jgi:hypothetical protein
MVQLLKPTSPAAEAVSKLLVSYCTSLVCPYDITWKTSLTGGVAALLDASRVVLVHDVTYCSYKCNIATLPLAQSPHVSYWELQGQ